MKKELLLWVALVCLVGAGVYLLPPIAERQRQGRASKASTQAASQPADNAPRPQSFHGSFPWLAKVDGKNYLANRIAAPDGLERTQEPPDSFAQWLRHLPLKPPGSPVLLYNGRRKANQDAHAAVVDIDVGKRDLQQCADAVIRLRAEWLFSRADHAAIRFRFTSGDIAEYPRWIEGCRPRWDVPPTVRGGTVRWSKTAPADTSRDGFRRFLDTVFQYAGTASLAKDLTPVPDVRDMRIGDVFIQPGSPGHAVIVADLAGDARTGRKVFLLVQGFMPAQDIHVLKNPGSAAMSPWYDLDFGPALKTPEWTFTKGDLRRF